MVTALITGSSGFVGQYLTQELAGRGMTVFGFDLVDSEDVTNYEHLRMRIDRVQPDLIFHLAAQAYVPESTIDPRRGFNTNVIGTLNLLEAVHNTGSHTRILLAGTSEEYGYDLPDVIDESTTTRPTSVYGATKLVAGHLGLVYARNYGMDVVVTRAFNHIGPGQSQVYAISALARRVALVVDGQLPSVTHGNLTAHRNYTDVRDVVRAYAEAIMLPSDVYNICSSNTVSIDSILKQLVDIAGGDIELVADPKLYRASNDRFPPVSWAKLNKATGWMPEIPLSTTLEEMYLYWKAHI